MFFKEKKEKKTKTKNNTSTFQKFNGRGIYRHVFLPTLNRTEFITFEIKVSARHR